MIDLDTGRSRFPDREALGHQFGIAPSATRLIVSGVGRDLQIERYWALPNRPALLDALHALGITLITPPNFSVLTGVPRSDNLHAMKRIMLAFCEMAQAGLPAALHVNARTERDYARWAEVIAARSGIDCITYRSSRRAQDAAGGSSGTSRSCKNWLPRSAGRCGWSCAAACACSSRCARPSPR